LLATLFFIFPACGARTEGESPPAGAGADAAATEHASKIVDIRPAPSWQEAANTAYVGVLDEDVVMIGGLWVGEPYVEGGASAPRAWLAADFLLTGELDGDGADEAVVLVWSSTGGSGTFDYLALVDRDVDGAVFNRATVPLGDRVRIRSAAIEDGRVVVDVVQAGPGDAACCPGQKMRRNFALEGETMKETLTEDQGRLSLADLDGEWRLLRFDQNEPVPEEVQITLLFQGTKIAGKAACNRYAGNVAAGDAPGELSLTGPLAVTRMMCQPPLMDWEQRYLQALEGLAQYSFTAGRLVLTWRRESDMGSFVFGSMPHSELPDNG